MQAVEAVGSPEVEIAKQDFFSMTKQGLLEAVEALGLPRFRAKQLWQWVYAKGAADFGTMHNLGKVVQEAFAARWSLERLGVSRHWQSLDGTVKWLLRFADGQEAEMVYIPEDTRGTLCISSQVGCTLTCAFCHTGTQRLVRNLTASEIIGQVMLAKDYLRDWPSSRPDRRLTNVVLMGMGEPLYNYEAVAAGLGVIMDGEGIGLSRRRITLSTSGVVPMIQRCGEELGVNLAVSLHAVRDELRNRLVPLNKKYPIAELMEACRRYPAGDNTQRITMEYVMLHGVNDSDEDARGLVRLLEGLPAKVNLIPFNPWPGTDFTCSTPERIAAFAAIVQRAGYASPVRTPRGRDILAACGQLKSETVKQRRSLVG